MSEKKRYTSEEVLNLQSQAYQKGLNEGYQLKKQEHPRGAVWVKCSDRLPGYKARVKWRDGNEHSYATDGKISLFEMEKPNLEGWEWYDESATGREEEWVDVNDRLPYKDGDSSVHCLVNDTYEGIVVRPFNEAHVCWDQEDGDDYYTDAKGGKITHWRPLPEPPKRKQQKEK